MEQPMAATSSLRMKSPVHPGGFVRHEIIAPLDLSVTEAAEALGVTRPALSAFLNERSACRRRWRCGLRKLSASRWTR